MAADQDFSIYAGDSKVLEITVLDDAGVALLIPAGATMKWFVSWSPYVDERKIEKNAVVEDANAGRIDVELEPDDTKNLSGVYYHGARMIETDGTVSTFLCGRITINRHAMAVA